MWKKIAIAGGTVALIGGIGTAALATSGSSSPNPSTSSSAASGQSGAAAKLGKHPRLERALQRLKNFEHGTWVTGSKNKSVTHSAVRGQVTAVSPSSITVQAADSTTMTFTIDSSTKVHTKAQHKDAPISSVQKGDTVIVTGTGTPTATAKQLLDTSR